MLVRDKNSKKYSIISKSYQGGDFLYKRFATLLKKNKITAYKVSKDTGITQTTLSTWKKGRSTPKIDKLIKLANYFNVPLAYFLVAGEKEGELMMLEGNNEEKFIENENLLGKQLRTLRVDQGLQSRDIANLLEIAKSTYSGYENGKSKPDYETLIKLANYYSVSIDFLLGNTEVKAPSGICLVPATGNVTKEVEKRHDEQIVGSMDMFANRLRKLRNEEILTQRELAELMNLSGATIAMYKTGKRSPDRETIIRLAKMFQVSVDYLLGVTDIRNYSDTPKSYLSGEVVEEMNELIRDLMKIRKATTAELFLTCDCGEGQELTAQEEMEFTDKLHEVQRLDGKIKLLKEMIQQKTEDILQLKKK
jgi:transcriptional regulator with XRE-family HTH domain